MSPWLARSCGQEVYLESQCLGIPAFGVGHTALGGSLHFDVAIWNSPPILSLHPLCTLALFHLLDLFFSPELRALGTAPCLVSHRLYLLWPLRFCSASTISSYVMILVLPGMVDLTPTVELSSRYFAERAIYSHQGGWNGQQKPSRQH